MERLNFVQNSDKNIENLVKRNMRYINVLTQIVLFNIGRRSIQDEVINRLKNYGLGVWLYIISPLQMKLKLKPNEMGEPERALKVFMMPWLGHGHISPFLELAKKLTKRNMLIYFCSTPINHQLTITKKLGLDYSDSIKLVNLHLPTLPNLPPHYHTTNGLPPHLMDTLKQAFKMSKDNITNILSDVKPDFIIYDLGIMYAQIPLPVGIPSIMFSILSATALSSFQHMATQPGQDFPFPSIYLHEYEKSMFGMLLNANKTSESINGDKSNKASDSSEVKPSRHCHLRLVKSSREIEGKYIDYLTRSGGGKVIPVGLLLDEEPHEDDDSQGLVQWVNSKEKRSCILVAFGSECFLKNEEIEEIAYGLEMSKVNFIWVLRISQEKDQRVKAEDILPKGFLERIGDRGRIIEGWAPQSIILKQQSIGGFLSHCGWCSILESLKNGVPIIAMPMQADQPFNARLVVELGVGLEISRDEMSGRLKREDVLKAVKTILLDKAGDGVRRNAWEFREKLLSNGEEEIDELAKELVLMHQDRNETL